ncbi:lysylphosphatidylglycerol synthase domain-containing protein [Chitinispirillales bacterium ANBcel5]|uniref:lysylphosphatidylglycerol synthase domain-containing protein n=1 Tax=Cellulosispirillum alkaliphilum TaxID=3039283 RepID=UPI002A5574C8|nr:lysylphosphatidylglycerol synthase domain-containing protein [Chitinispirillales bacterium ANBcel5]
MIVGKDVVSRIYRWCRVGYIKWSFRILVTLIFVAIVNRTVTLSEINDLLGRVTLPHLFAAFVLGVTGLFFQILRWHSVLLSLKIDTKLSGAAKTFLWGCFLGFLTPGKSGELFRAFELAPSKKSRTVLAALLDRFYSGVVILFAGIIAAALQFFSTDVKPLRSFLTPAVIFFTLSLLLLVFSKGISESIGAFSGDKKYLKTIARTILPSFITVATPLMIVFSVFSHCILLLQTTAVISMFIELDFAILLFIAAQSYAFMLLLPIFVANAGIREYSFFLFLNLFSVDASKGQISGIAMAASLLILIINILLPAIIGLIWMFLGTKRENVIPGQKSESAVPVISGDSSYE